MPNDINLISDMRALFKEGASVSELMAEIHRRHGHPLDSGITTSVYFRKAYDITLHEAMLVAGHVQYTAKYGYTGLNDAEIDALLRPLIEGKRHVWDIEAV